MLAPESEPNFLRAGHAACPGCGLATGMKLVLQAMGPRTIAVIVPSCEGSIGGVYPVTAYGVSTFHSAFEIAAPTAAGIANALKIQGKDDIQVVAFAGRNASVIGFPLFEPFGGQQEIRIARYVVHIR